MFPFQLIGRRALVLGGLVASTLLPWQGSMSQDPQPQEGAGSSVEAPEPEYNLLHDPRAWLPANESLRFMVEVTLGPVRGLDIGKVTLTSVLAPDSGSPAVEATAEGSDSRRLIGTIGTKAEGGYLGHEVVHTIKVRWYVGTRPRIELAEDLRGSRSVSRQVAIGEVDGQWQLEYRKDRHCKGCKDRAHYTKGRMPWSKFSHCDGCQRPDHRIWRDYEYLDVPPDAIDMVSALYFARGFLLSEEQETVLALVQQDELWMVRLRRGGTRKIKTKAGTFECMRVLIGPELAAGEGLGEEAAERFEALFGLHGDISVWVDRKGGFPVVIEGSAPFGPFDVSVKVSLISRRGG